MIVLGVGGGATKTHCVVLDQQRRMVGEGYSGSSNRHSVGEAVAQANLSAAIQAALAATDRQPGEVQSIGLGMAGVDRPHERTLVAGWLNNWLPGVRAVIENDALAALAGGAGELFGVVVVSGTGMIVYGVNRQGERRRAGGWGALIDAHGSGYALAIAALRAIARAADGIDPPTALTAVLLRHLGLERPAQLIPWIYGDLTWARFAELAPWVVQCAEQGDPVALALVDQTTAALAEAVQPVVTGLNLAHAPFPLVLAGGNLQAGLIRTQLVARLGGQIPGAQVVEQPQPPAVGAAFLAWPFPPAGQ